MVYLAALMLLLGALLLVVNHLLTERRRVRQVNQRLQGHLVRENRFGNWLRALGNSKFGQRSVSIDSETQTLLSRLGWRRASERSLYAACQIGTPLLALGLALFLQEVFFPHAANGWLVPMLATGAGYLLPSDCWRTPPGVDRKPSPWKSPRSSRCCASCSSRAWRSNKPCACSAVKGRNCCRN